jgi:hypothetical protein
MTALRMPKQGEARDLILLDGAGSRTGDRHLEVRGCECTPNELDWSATRIEVARPTLHCADCQSRLVRPPTPIVARSRARSVKGAVVVVGGQQGWADRRTLLAGSGWRPRSACSGSWGWWPSPWQRAHCGGVGGRRRCWPVPTEPMAMEMPCVREEYVHDCRREAWVFPEWRT